jgi:hypothetical protein
MSKDNESVEEETSGSCKRTNQRIWQFVQILFEREIRYRDDQNHMRLQKKIKIKIKIQTVQW